MILTLRELADYLRVNERTILRMLKTGQVQGAKIGGQWRFNSSQIDGLFFPPEEGAEVEGEESLGNLARSYLSIPVSRMMAEDRMIMDMQATQVSEVIEELTPRELLGKLVMEVESLRAKCLAREQLLSTGVGNGVAIPHPRDPVATLKAPAMIIFGRSAKGIDFGAVDGKPVHLFFLLCCQNIEIHLHLMGRMAKLLRNRDFLAQCQACENPGDVLRVVLEFER
ncbi:MAG: PTS sugar transporter subunit IIA, partial [Lentisphaeria bacterium]|nr:PTS sugar transporter subunit IIA [Lentisphaeria bacterium]